MADDIRNAGAVVGVTRWGVPWHGRIEAGTLYTGKLDALGNEITRAWNQPASGDCWLIQKAGVAADPYLDAAADKAAAAIEGKELTSYALLAGTMLHNTEIGFNSWIYTAPGGQVWLVGFPYLSGVERSLTTTGSFSLTFTRFGAFGIASESKTVSVSIPHVGTANSIDYTLALPFISDIKQDGSAVAIGLNPTTRYYVPLDDTGFYELGHLDHSPIGFVELTLSGSTLEDLSASAVVVSDADATVGYPGIQNFIDADSNVEFEHVRRWAAWYQPAGTLGFFEIHKTETAYCIGGLSSNTKQTVMTFGAQQIVHDWSSSGLACSTYPATPQNPLVSFINVFETKNRYMPGGDEKADTGLFFYSKTMVRHRSKVYAYTLSTDIGYACVFHKYGKDEDYHPALDRSRLVRNYGSVNPKSLAVALSDSPVSFT